MWSRSFRWARTSALERRVGLVASRICIFKICSDDLGLWVGLKPLRALFDE